MPSKSRPRSKGGKRVARGSKGGKRVARVFNVLMEQDEEGWLVGSVPELPGCHTQAKSLDELEARIKDAILLYLEVEGDPTTRSHGTKFRGIHQVEVTA